MNGENKSKLALMVLWLAVYPGWLDLILIFILYRINKIYAPGSIELYAMILGVVFLRFLIYMSLVRFAGSPSKNWYTKQAIYIFVTLLVAYLYNPSTFTWIFAVYFFVALFFQLLAVICTRLR